MGTLRHSCAKVRDPSQLRFGLVRALGRGIAVLDRGPRRTRGREVFFWRGERVGPHCLLLGIPIAPQQRKQQRRAARSILRNPVKDMKAISIFHNFINPP